MNQNLGPDFDPELLRRKYAEERAKRLRSDGNEQYQELKGAFARLDQDPYVEPGFTRAPVEDDVEVLIVGGGLSCLLTAGRLREAGVRRIRIIEKAGDFGGTWYWNRYPGCACDIESYIYLPLLEETGYIPTEKYAKAAEIYEYCRLLGRHYALYDAALFQTSVTGLRWDEARRRWAVSTDRDDRISAQFVIVASGFLSKPKVPRIPGIESFAGHDFHTSRWDYDYTGGDSGGSLTKLADKAVGIIGTGATAIQSVPYLAQYARHLYVFQRTPSSCDARNNRPTDFEWFKTLEPGWQKRRMRNFDNIIAGIKEAEDLVNDGWTDILGSLSGLDDAGRPLDAGQMEILQFAKMEKSRQRIDALVKDPKTAAALKPWYNYFCKRPTFNDAYLETFNRANVTLVDTEGKGVERITPKGPVVAGREYPVDCLVYATGFEVLTEFTSQNGFDVEGRCGRLLSDYWSQGTRTLHGMLTRGFPNLIILGVAQNGAQQNFTSLVEQRAAHLAYLIPRCLNDRILTIEPTQEAEDAWVNEIIATRGPRRAFLEACTPSHYNHEGKETPAVALNDTYPAGMLAFFEVLETWRAEDRLSEMEITRGA